MDVVTKLLLIADIFLFSAFLYFAFESYREQEARATKIGLVGAAIAIIIGIFIFIPDLKNVVVYLFSTGCILSLSLLIPANPNKKALKGTKGYLVGQAQRFDERNSVFARYRSLTPGTERYDYF